MGLALVEDGGPTLAAPGHRFPAVKAGFTGSTSPRPRPWPPMPVEMMDTVMAGLPFALPLTYQHLMNWKQIEGSIQARLRPELR